MRGTMIVIRPKEPAVQFKHIDGRPDLEPIKEGLEGGYLEVVPYFTRISFEGDVHRCVAFCDEDGARKGLPYNGMATALWHAQANGAAGLLMHGDHIKGNLVVVFGDSEWMSEL